MTSLIPPTFYEFMRSTYQQVWEQNVFNIAIIKDLNPKGRDFGYENSPPNLQVIVEKANIQFTNQQLPLQNRGYIVGDKISVYLLYNTQMDDTSFIIWNGSKWKVENSYKGFYQGKAIYWRAIMAYIEDVRDGEKNWLRSQGVPEDVLTKSRV